MNISLVSNVSNWKYILDAVKLGGFHRNASLLIASYHDLVAPTLPISASSPPTSANCWSIFNCFLSLIPRWFKFGFDETALSAVFYFLMTKLMSFNVLVYKKLGQDAALT